MDDKRNHQDCDAHECGYKQNGESTSIRSMPIQNVRSNQWPKGCASLIKGLIQTEYPPMSDASAGMSQHGLYRRAANSAPGSFGYDQRSSKRPTPCERKGGHCQHVNCVPSKSRKPVPVRLIRKVSRNRSQPVADHFTKTGHKANDSRAGPKRTQKWADDAPGTLVGEVREKVDYTDNEDEAKREFGGISAIGIHSGPASR
jgi:hypothetical protein